MTRSKAIAILRNQVSTLYGAEALVDALEVLGLLKFDHETINVPIISFISDYGGKEPGCKSGLASVRLDTMIETLRMAGYCVIKEGTKL